MAKGGGIAYLAATVASQEIEALSQALARLPGLGPRSARRAVLYLVKKRETALQPLVTALQNVADKLSTCSVCGNVDTSDPCAICRDPRRDEKMLCVVEEVADLWALDRSRLLDRKSTRLNSSHANISYAVFCLKKKKKKNKQID